MPHTVLYCNDLYCTLLHCTHGKASPGMHDPHTHLCYSYSLPTPLCPHLCPHSKIPQQCGRLSAPNPLAVTLRYGTAWSSAVQYSKIQYRPEASAATFRCCCCFYILYKVTNTATTITATANNSSSPSHHSQQQDTATATTATSRISPTLPLPAPVSFPPEIHSQVGQTRLATPPPATPSTGTHKVRV